MSGKAKESNSDYFGLHLTERSQLSELILNTSIHFDDVHNLTLRPSVTKMLALQWKYLDGIVNNASIIRSVMTGLTSLAREYMNMELEQTQEEDVMGAKQTTEHANPGTFQWLNFTLKMESIYEKLIQISLVCEKLLNGERSEQPMTYTDVYDTQHTITHTIMDEPHGGYLTANSYYAMAETVDKNGNNGIKYLKKIDLLNTIIDLTNEFSDMVDTFEEGITNDNPNSDLAMPVYSQDTELSIDLNTPRDSQTLEKLSAEDQSSLPLSMEEDGDDNFIDPGMTILGSLKIVHGSLIANMINSINNTVDQLKRDINSESGAKAAIELTQKQLMTLGSSNKDKDTAITQYSFLRGKWGKHKRKVNDFMEQQRNTWSNDKQNEAEKLMKEGRKKRRNKRRKTAGEFRGTYAQMPPPLNVLLDEELTSQNVLAQHFGVGEGDEGGGGVADPLTTPLITHRSNDSNEDDNAQMDGGRKKRRKRKRKTKNKKRKKRRKTRRKKIICNCGCIGKCTCNKRRRKSKRRKRKKMVKSRRRKK